MALDKATLRRLSGLSDPFGVLSMYVTIYPTQEASDRPAWKVRMEKGLNELRQRVGSEGPRERWMALEQRLEALQPQLEWLVDPRQSGRGHALFAPLSTDEFHQVTVQLEVGDEISCDSIAHVNPLLGVWERGAPAGIAALSADGLRLIDSRFGMATDVGGVEFDPDSDEWRERKAPSGSSPAGQRSVSQVDLFETRMSEWLRKFMATSNSIINQYIRENDWEYLVISGDARLREPLLRDLHNGHVRLVESSQVIGQVTATQAAEQVATELDSARQAHERELLSRAQETKRVAWGLSETLAALDQGQVDTVLMSENASWPGRVSESGRISPPGVVLPGDEESPMRELPDLTERIIARAFEAGAQVELLQNGNTDGLGEAEGLAALLRW